MADFFDSVAPSTGAVMPAHTWVNPSSTSLPVRTLNGEWGFRLFPSPDAPELWGDTASTTPEERIFVPSHWVLTDPADTAPRSASYHPRHSFRRGGPIYTNVQFPFPFNPPHAPANNPTAEYRRTFDLTDNDLAGRILLRFDGVESVAWVEVNGSHVGTTRGSRLPTEFDITDVVLAGTNTLRVIVTQWSAMSYVEDQDQWWLPGIFRDVSLIIKPAGAIDDARVTADFDPVTGTGILSLRVDSTAPAATLESADLPLGTRHITTNAWHSITIPRVEPWSAEVPRLYSLTVATPAETRKIRVGFRRVTVTEGPVARLLVNGAPIELYGVNRHDTNPDAGRVFNEDFVRRDLELMKRANINAIRTSHYPPHPRFLDLADEMGFWIIDEVDFETHGFEAANWAGNPADAPEWAPVLVDRARRTVSRDFNHPSVIMWSLGNESDDGGNLALMAAEVRHLDPTRPVHYEADHDGRYTDVASRMYCPLEEVEAYCTGKGRVFRGSVTGIARERALPFMLCEYGHTMGNGAGALARYVELMDRYPNFIGGFVWEWRDHCLRTWSAEGTEYFGYGGDFGERVHDSNFVADGLVRADGVPSPALAELREAYAPLRVVMSRLSDDAATREPLRFRFTVRNRLSTLRSGSLTVIVDADGVRVGHLVHDVAPGETGEAQFVPDGVTEATAAERLRIADTVTVTGYWANTTAWNPDNRPAFTTQWRRPIAFSSTPREGSTQLAPEGGSLARQPETAPATGNAPVVELSPDGHQLTGLLGMPIEGLRPSFWRAPTDNDRLHSFGSYAIASPEETGGIGAAKAPSSEEEWRRAGLDRMMLAACRVSTTGDATNGSLTRVERWAPADRPTYVTVSWRWNWSTQGNTPTVALDVDAAPSTGWWSTAPRSGIVLDIPQPRHIRWDGLGPGEAYADSLLAAHRGTFDAAPEDLSFAYARPQENGTRPGLRKLKLDGDHGVVVLTCHPNRTLPAYSDHYPSWSLHAADEFELTTAKHPYELPAPGPFWHLYIDGGQHGLGSRSCGPDTRPEYAWGPRAYHLSIEFTRGE